MKDKLRKGQAFIGIDNKKYYFLGYDYDEQIMFTDLDLWTEKEQKYIIKSNIFIKEILSEYEDIIESCGWYYQSLTELEQSTTEEKVKRCFDIIESLNTDEFKLKPVKIGGLVKGQAYSKINNQYYQVIGFIVENNVYVDKILKARQKGFFSIYHSKCDDTVPLIFERNYKPDENTFNCKHFVAGNNDKVDVIETLISKEKVNNSINGNLKDRLENNFDERRYH